jgi:hypothetical protein
MSSTLSVIAKSLAPALSVPETKINDWLKVVMYRACEELLLSGAVYLSGIGTFRKAHVASRPTEQNGEMWLLPPRYTVELLTDSDDSSGGLLYDEALDSLGVDDETAEKLSMGFATAVQKTLEFKGQLALEPLGTLTLTGKDLTLQPSEWLLDLLNKPYQELVAISLSEKQPHQALPEQPALAKQTQEKTDLTDVKPIAPEPKTEAPTTTAQSLSPPPKVQSAEFNPADFGLDSGTLQQKSENRIFIEQSGLLADIEAKSNKSEKKKSLFQPPIPISDDEISNFLLRDTQEPAIGSETPSAESLSTESQIPAPPPKVPKEGIGKGTVITLIIVGIAVVAIIMTFFFVSRSLRTFPTSSTALKSPAATTTSEAKKTIAGQNTEPASETASPKKEETPKQNEGTENLVASKPVEKSDGTKPPTPTPTNPKEATPSVATPEPSSTPSNWPPELSTPVVEAKGGWCIVVASRPSEAEALEVANTFAQKGFNVSIKPRTVNGELRYRVRVGQFAQQNEALKAIKQYATQLPKGAFLDKIQ